MHKMRSTNKMGNYRQSMDVQYYQSPCGELILASYDGKLCLCDWYDKPCAEHNKKRTQRILEADAKEESSTVLNQTKKELDEYFAGIRNYFNVPLLLTGTDFQKKVWLALLEIPYGETRTYLDIARRVNNPKGVRAVAQAIGANGISLFIPCHRVIGSNHSLPGFAGGLDAKRLLLGLEGADI